MKKIVKYHQDDEIPDNAKYLAASTHTNGTFFFFYEIPVKKEKSVKKSNETEVIIDDVIILLNSKTGKKFSQKTKRTRDLIRARLNDGHDFNAFNIVIHKKCSEWLDDPRWNQYLRPETLFGNKFESYLNQSTGQEMNEQAFNELDNLIEGINGN